MRPLFPLQTSSGSSISSHLRCDRGLRTQPSRATRTNAPVQLVAAQRDFLVPSRSEEYAATSPAKALELVEGVQQYMVQLNNHRVQLAEQLSAANKKMRDLEQRVERLQRDAEASAAPKASPPSAPTPPPAPVDTISIEYHSGWNQAFLHCKVDNQGWTQVPGHKLNRSGQGCWTMSVPGRQMEFVLNNGHNDWDTPQPYQGKSSNYLIHEPGNYRLKNGRLQKTS